MAERESVTSGSSQLTSRSSGSLFFPAKHLDRSIENGGLDGGSVASGSAMSRCFVYIVDLA